MRLFVASTEKAIPSEQLTTQSYVTPVNYTINHDQLHPLGLTARFVLCCIRIAIQLKLIFYLGKVRLAKWFQTMPQKAKAKIVKDVTQLVLARRTRMCNFLEYKGALYYVSYVPCFQ